MNEFLKTYRLALTPLSPIHIGCGEDFEPTNYVIDGGVLYGFDPSRAELNELQKSKLAAAVNKNSLLAIQRFFKDHAEVFQALADAIIPVCSGVAEKYEKDIGRAANIEASGNQVFNRFIIERTMHTGRLGAPYIPGSSFKGAIRTAMLDVLNKGQQPFDAQFKPNGEAKSTEAVEKRLFKGDFETSPLRLLKVADLMAAKEPARRIMFAVNRKKERKLDKNGAERESKGIAARKECILQGQYRLFIGDAVLPSLDPHQDAQKTPAKELRPTDFRPIARESNAYHLGRLRRELQVLDGRGFVNPAWRTSIETLLAGELGKKLASGDAFLIRLGRYGGAESKTFSGADIARIKIMQGQGQPALFQSETKTVWLAAEREDATKHLIPFGWAVVEINPQADLPELKAWCQTESKSHLDVAALRHTFEGERVAAVQRKAQAAIESAARETAKQAEQKAHEMHGLLLASMSTQARKIEDLRLACEALAKKLPPNGNFKKQAADTGKAGLFQDASKLVALALTAPDWTTQDKLALADMLEQWLPQVVAPWDKEQRKKLKIAVLKSGSAP